MIPRDPVDPPVLLTEGILKRMGNLRQFQGKTPLQVRHALRRERVRPQDVLDLSKNFPPNLRRHYRKEVERILAEVAKEVDGDLARPRIEVFVAIDLLVRMQLALAVRAKGMLGVTDARALDVLIARLWAMADHLEVLTPRGRRIGGRLTRESERSAVAASAEAVARMRAEREEALEDALEERYGPPPLDLGAET